MIEIYMFKTNWMDNLILILSESTWLLIPKKPTLLFEKSTGRRPGWCGQPLQVVGLGRDGTLHGTYESGSCLFPLGRPVSRKACKKQKTKKTSTIVINDCFNTTSYLASSTPFCMRPPHFSTWYLEKCVWFQ